MQEEITEEKTIENMEMELIAQECSVSTDDVMEYPPTALSLGEKTIQTKNGDINIPIGIGTYGNFSFVQAPPKTKKTFFYHYVGRCLFKWSKYIWWRLNKRS